MDNLDHLVYQDEKARLEALDPTRSFIVQAPAGSGKTELLTQRYLKLLSRIEKGPEEIIAVTFTKKAAAEMRSRVVNALIEAKNTLEPPVIPHARLTWQLARAALEQCEQKKWDLIAYPNQLRILTIDALCSHLASRMPILSNFGATPDVTSHPEHLYQKAVDSLMLYFQNTPDQKILKTLLKQLDNRLELAEKLMITMLGKRDQWLVHIAQLKNHQGEVVPILEQGLQRIIIDRLTKSYEAFQNLDLQKETFFSFIRYLANNLLEADPSHPLVLFLDSIDFPKPTLEALSQWRALQNLFLTQAGELRKTFTIQHGFLAPSKAKNKEEKALRTEYKVYMESLMEVFSEVEEVKLALSALDNLPPSELSDSQSQMITSLIELLPLLTAHLTLQFKESGKVDFIEVALRAVAALGQEDAPTDLALSLDHQLKHLLIDEFQDTSFAQFYLFEKLIAGWSMGEGRTLFLVGDPMQSIYRFRGAEVGLFLHVQYKGLNQIILEPLRLTRNFRSHSGIVQWVNTYFQSIFPSIEDRQSGAVVYAPAIAHKTQVQTNSVFFYPQRDEKSQYCVQLIVQLLEASQTSDHSIAVLVRARRHLDTLLPLLRQLNIPFEAHDIEHLGLKQSILDLLSLTQALLDLSDKIAWLAVLRAPWCGLTLSDLYVIASDPKQPILWSVLLNYKNLALSQEGKHRLERIMPILEHWLYHRQRHRLSAWIKGAWSMLGGPHCYPDTPILSQAKVYFELLEKQSESGDLMSMLLFEKTLSTLFAPGYTFGNTSDKTNVLQLMTIHKSKGLEFDIVIVPALEKLGRPNQSELLIWYERKHEKGVDLIVAPRKAQHQSVDTLYQHVHTELAKKSELENARLLYVAVTRAKKQIHLFGQVFEKAPSQGSFLAYLWPQIQDYKVESLDAQEIIEEVESNVEIKLSRLPTDWPLPVPIGLHPVDVTKGLNHPEHHYHLDKLVGIFTHKILQFIAELGLAYWDKMDLSTCIPAWRMALMRLGVRSEDIPKAIERVSRAIQSTLKSPIGRQIFDSTYTSAHNEWVLQYRTREGMKQIIIDRTYLDHQGIRWIIDYKLGEELSDYYEKLSLYAKIISQLEARDMRSIRCALYFPLKPIEHSFKEIKI